MRSFSIDERRARLARRQFLYPGRTDDLVAITGAVIGWHATDPATPYLSLWSRVPGFATADLDGELYEKRSLVKQLAMRRTLWLVDAAHLPMLQPAAADRVADTEERRLIADVEKAGVCPRTARTGWTAAEGRGAGLSRRASPRLEFRTAPSTSGAVGYLQPGTGKVLRCRHSAGSPGADGARGAG